MVRTRYKEDGNIYNSRIIDTYIKLIRKKYSFININELLDHAKMKSYEVADQGHWFTQEQIDLFHGKLVQLSGNADIAREAGRYAASPEASGIMRQYFIGFIGPARAFEMVTGKGSASFTKSALYEAKKITNNKVEIVVTPCEGVTEKPFQCENRMGFFEAIPRLFNHSIPDIEHPECIFRGDKVCRYTITWKCTKSDFVKRVRNYLAIAFFFAVLLSLFVSQLVDPWILLSAAVFLVMFLSLMAKNMENDELLAGLDNLRDSTEETLNQINTNYNNALITNEIGQAISGQMDIDNILAGVIRVLEKRLDYDRGLVLLADAGKSKLAFRTGYGYSDEQANFLKKTSFHLDRPESKGIFVLSFRERKPFLINDFAEIENNLSTHSLAFARKMGSQSFICCPIICEGESLGILAVDNFNSKKPLIQSDMSLLMGIAPVIGISIRNANLVEARVRQFSSILQVMAASIDARDNLTAGHSERVTGFALGICEELGLSSDYVEMIRVASLLHDYGKIGVPDAVLKKPGPLTLEEREKVKSHAAKTRAILEQINFEGIYRQVPEIAGGHHEKIDGTGYPLGLKGSEIPLGAKIIAVADFFEAVTAKRHYRKPMPFEHAVGLLHANIGTHFEKKIVNALLNYLEKSEGSCSSETLKGIPVAEIGLGRFQCRIPVFVELNGTSIHCSSIDISMGGIFVANDADVPEGQEIELSLARPDNYCVFYRTRGRIAWVNRERERKKPSFPAGFGVEFNKLPDDAVGEQFPFISCLDYSLLSPADKQVYDEVS